MSHAVDIWQNGQPTGSGRPFFVASSAEAVARGLIPGARIFRCIGLNADVDDLREDVWEVGGDYVFPSNSGEQMRLVSTSVNDTAAGSGARQVEIHYLDGSGNEAVTAVTLNGTTPVLTVPADIRRIQNFHVVETGSLNLAAGNISLTNLAGTVTYGRISANANRARQAVISVPAGKRGFIVEAWLGGNAEGGSLSNYAEGYLRATCDFTTGELTPGLFNFTWGMVSASNTIGGALNVPIVLPPLCDIKVSVTSRAANSNVRVVGAFAGWFEDAEL